MLSNKKLQLDNRGSTFFIFVVIAAIAISEYIFAYRNVTYGIVLSLFLTIAIYIIVSVVSMDKGFMISAESLALIPLYILFTSSLPWFFINQQYLLPAVYSIILALCFWHIYENDIDIRSLFHTQSIAEYTLIGALIAIPTGIIEYLILTPLPAYPSFEVKHLLTDTVYMVLFVGVGEELLFRGIIMNDLKNIFGWRNAILTQGVIFGIMHMTWHSTYEIAFTFLAGVLLGYFYFRTKSLFGPIVLHGVNNVVLVSLLPYFFPHIIK